MTAIGAANCHSGFRNSENKSLLMGKKQKNSENEMIVVAMIASVPILLNNSLLSLTRQRAGKRIDEIGLARAIMGIDAANAAI